MGGSRKRMAAPVAVGSTFKQGAGNKFRMVQNADGSTRVYGRSFIAPVGTTTAGMFESNDIGLIFDVNPNLLGDRVATIASTFEKYVYQAVKFTWVPQCGTSTPGSVVMVMDRDNLTDAANPQSASYLQEAMGYEHAVISPPWTEFAVSYLREKSEKKIFQGHLDQDSIGGKDATQGNFLVYTMGCPASASLGFIVMDFVLDLITPSMIPERTGASMIGYNVPGQWSMFNLSLTPRGRADVDLGGVALGLPWFQWAPSVGSTSANFPAWDKEGAVYELCLAGSNAITFNNGEFFWDGSGTVAVNLSKGSKLYAVILANKPGQSTPITAGLDYVLIFTSNLNTALSMASSGVIPPPPATSANYGSAPPNCIHTARTTAFAQSFWGRRITMTGNSSSLNQA